MQANAQQPGFTISLGDQSPKASSGRLPSADASRQKKAVTPRPFARRRRNRHGRGLRGPLLRAGLPGSRTRAESFEDLVVDSAVRLRELWAEPLEAVEYLVEEVPDRLEEIIAAGEQAPLGKSILPISATPERPGVPAQILIYRHPVEALCDSPWQLRELVHEVLIEQVATLLNVDPETVDPLFRRFRHGH